MSSPVDYDRVAAKFNNRYAHSDYGGVERALTEFVSASAGSAQRHVLEAGCGTGRWLTFLAARGARAVGIDMSEGMLRLGRASDSHMRLARARAEALPFATSRFDRIVGVNALHHFTDRAAFFGEARRVLRSGGGLLTIGLDPERRTDRWWLYDYFPQAFAEDLVRYPSAAAIHELMAAAGFIRCETVEVQRFLGEMTIREAETRGFLERTRASQTMVISDADFEAGIARLRAADPDTTLLGADLRLYGTVGWIT